jgi:hypothetical protein
MKARGQTATAIGTAKDISERAKSVDWGRVSEELDARGCSRIERLVTPEECDALVTLYPVDRIFRSRVVMARHGFGRGEYKYFAYPLPELVAQLRAATYPRLAPIANRWNAAMGIDVQYPDAPLVAIWRGRLQLLASGPLRRTRLPASGRDSVVRARAGLHGRRVRAHGAAAANAVPTRSRTASARGRGRFRRSSPPGPGHARGVSGQPPAWRQPRALWASPHGRHHLPRRDVMGDRLTLAFSTPAAPCLVFTTATASWPRPLSRILRT